MPSGHPLRVIRVVIDEALGVLSDTFAKLYPPAGRSSILAEKLLRAMLLQAFFGIRPERQLMD